MAEKKAGGGALSRLQINRSRVAAPSRRRRRKLIAGLAASVVVILALIFLTSRPPAVEMAEVRQARPGEAATVLSASGYVSSRRRSIIAPQVPGRLIEVSVEEGQTIEQGQIIARLDAADAEVALSQARAQKEAAAARVRTAEAAVTKARRDLARTRTLAATGAVARSALQDAITNQRSVESDLQAARGALAASSEAAAAAALQQEHTVVRAPFTGTVVRKIASEGAVLAPAAITAADVGGIVELVDLGALEVDAEVSEEQLRRVHPGMAALIFLDAFPDRFWRGTTGTVRPAIDKAKATAVVKVGFDEAPGGALPDMGARISFLSEPLSEEVLRSEPRLRVPASAVIERDGQTLVFLVEGGRAKAFRVTVATRLGDEVALADGPKPGTPVVAAPGPDVREGSRLEIREPS